MNHLLYFGYSHDEEMVNKVKLALYCLFGLKRNNLKLRRLKLNNYAFFTSSDTSKKLDLSLS